MNQYFFFLFRLKSLMRVGGKEKGYTHGIKKVSTKFIFYNFLNIFSFWSNVNKLNIEKFENY